MQESPRSGLGSFSEAQITKEEGVIGCCITSPEIILD
jgi:hypothetical protein